MNHQQVKNLTIHELVKRGEGILKSFNQPDAAIDAKLLAKYLLKCDTVSLLINANVEVADHILESYMYLIAKRTQGIPLQHITREQEFMGLSFYVDERVLIPRQDTETLIEEIIKISEQDTLHKAVEIGVGSGCISVSLAHFIPKMNITAIDICEQALEVAKANVVKHNMEDRIKLLQSNVFEKYDGKEEVDLIVSNPPYISVEECKTLMQEVINFEPRKALTDEGDGLKFYKEISKEAKKYLREGGILAYEIGYNQGKSVSELLEVEGYREIRVIQDLAGKDRVVIAKK